MIPIKNLYRQFSKPSGPIGWLAGKIMSLRSSNRLRNEWTVDNLDIKDGHTLLEIGFGPGLAIQKIVRKYPNCKIVGIDHSSLMVEMAKTRNLSAVQNGQVKLHCLDVDDLSQLGKFDRIYTLNSHMFWSNLTSSMRLLVSHCNSGGLISITYQPRGSVATDEKAKQEALVIQTAMRATGLENIKIERLQTVPTTVCVIGQVN